jgi:hypothetical protein
VHAAASPNDENATVAGLHASLLMIALFADSKASVKTEAASETGGGAPSTCMSCAANSNTLVPAKIEEQLNPPYNPFTS